MRILMVCLGNICRSPLAHGVLESLVKKEGLDWEIDSAGTGDWHVGQAPDRRAIHVAKTYGIDISGQRAQHFNASHFKRYDRILVMDRENLSNVLALAESPEQRAKVSLFMDNDIVQDPYYDDALFEPVFKQIHDRCIQLIEEFRGAASGPVS